jgi:hypothetical protein
VVGPEPRRELRPLRRPPAAKMVAALRLCPRDAHRPLADSGEGFCVKLWPRPLRAFLRRCDGNRDVDHRLRRRAQPIAHALARACQCLQVIEVATRGIAHRAWPPRPGSGTSWIWGCLSRRCVSSRRREGISPILRVGLPPLLANCPTLQAKSAATAIEYGRIPALISVVIIGAVTAVPEKPLELTNDLSRARCDVYPPIEAGQPHLQRHHDDHACQP